MADYISRQEAIKAIMDLPNTPNGYSDTYDKACIIGMLAEVPTADVVPVVRCKDCKHSVKQHLGYGCEMNYRLATNGEWFCADGEGREDAEIHQS